MYARQITESRIARYDFVELNSSKVSQLFQLNVLTPSTVMQTSAWYGISNIKGTRKSN